MPDFNKHRDLWNKAMYGDLSESIAAASELNDLGEISEKTFQGFVFVALSASAERKGGKAK